MCLLMVVVIVEMMVMSTSTFFIALYCGCESMVVDALLSDRLVFLWSVCVLSPLIHDTDVVFTLYWCGCIQGGIGCCSYLSLYAK